MKNQFKPHPWHGISSGADAPNVVTVYVEIVPTDTVKYEIDKPSGYLKIDRPQKYSNQCPALYGFVPQTYCGKKIAARCEERTKRSGIKGDGDPLDICVLSEKAVTHGDILVRAVPIGGLRMVDKNEADDKIIAVLFEDNMYGKFKDIAELPQPVVDRLHHYFLTYKDFPGANAQAVSIPEIYDAAEARKVIQLSQEDYNAEIVAS